MTTAIGLPSILPNKNFHYFFYFYIDDSIPTRFINSSHLKFSTLIKTQSALIDIKYYILQSFTLK